MFKMKTLLAALLVVSVSAGIANAQQYNQSRVLGANDKVNVLYRRPDNNLGLITPEL